ncbi:MAG TPA: hypothetical protein PLY70_12300, partial [Saprospiraceae bacterium]|nr:hypothetical protein [Saprospiraceae bacterium]
TSCYLVIYKFPISTVFSIQYLLDVIGVILFILTFLYIVINRFVLTNNHKHNISLNKLYVPRFTSIVFITILVFKWAFIMYDIEVIGGNLSVEDGIYSIISNGRLVRFIDYEQFDFYTRILVGEEILFVGAILILNLFIYLYKKKYLSAKK